MTKNFRKKTILFHYMLGNPTGGSDHSLFYHLLNLDKSKYEPIVIFNGSSFQKQILDDLNVKTVIIPLSKGSSNANAIVSKPKKHFPLWKILKEKFGREMKAVLKTIPEIRILKNVFKEYKIDLIHTNFNLSGSRPAIAAAIIFNVPIIAHNRGLSNLLRIDKFLSKYIKKIVCISEHVKKEYTEFGIPAEKCAVIHNGVDTEKFKPCSDIQKSNFVVTSIGRLEAWKGQRLLIEAASVLSKTYKDIKFWIIGNGSEKIELEKLINELGLQKTVVMMGNQDNIVNYLQDSSIFVHTSNKPEPFGRVIIEAMACGKPVIASNEGGPVEIIDSGINGILIPPNDLECLIKHLKILLENRTYRDELGNNARKKIVSEFSVRSTTMNIQLLYDEVFSGLAS